MPHHYHYRKHFGVCQNPVPCQHWGVNAHTPPAVPVTPGAQRVWVTRGGLWGCRPQTPGQTCHAPSALSWMLMDRHLGYNCHFLDIIRRVLGYEDAELGGGSTRGIRDRDITIIITINYYCWDHIKGSPGPGSDPPRNTHSGKLDVFLVAVTVWQ